MTPFGARLRQLRAERRISLKAMAAALGVSSSYLSALEHGKRGKPPWYFVQRVIAFFNVIWDEAEELQRLALLSDPRIVIDTVGLTPAHTTLANELARHIRALDADGAEDLAARLKALAKP